MEWPGVKNNITIQNNIEQQLLAKKDAQSCVSSNACEIWPNLRARQSKPRPKIVDSSHKVLSLAFGFCRLVTTLNCKNKINKGDGKTNIAVGGAIR